MIREFIVSAIGALGGAIGFAMLLNAPKKTLLPASITAMLGSLLYLALLVLAGTSAMTAYFLSSAFMSVLCEIEARWMRMPSTIFFLSALVPLVPGYTIYCAMLALVENDGAAAGAAALSALQGIAAIAVGAVVASVLFRTYASHRRARR